MVEVLQAFQSDDTCRNALLVALRSAPWQSFFWEWPPIAVDSGARAFECVVLPALGLVSAMPDKSAFAAPLGLEVNKVSDLDLVAAFANISGDATLLAPKPMSLDLSCYAHLATFVRGAPELQQHQLLVLLGIKAIEMKAKNPLWINTCGLGVHWLHIRLDKGPKYYSYQPYYKYPFSEIEE